MKSPMKQRTDTQQAVTNGESIVDKQQSVSTANDQKPWLFKPGQSGNPAGRPKGSRQKLAESFLADLAAHWSLNGKTALQAAYEKNPVEYVRVVASLLPKNVAVDVDVKYERIERVIVPARVIEHDPLPVIESDVGATCVQHDEPSD